MLTAMEMMNCPNLAVPAEVMQHIVNVESGRNPYAIGVVGGQLVRQPQNIDEALSTVNMLESKGYNFSLGLAQVNRFNLGRYGLSYEQAFNACSNLSAGSRILAQCYTSSGGDWGKSFSCYYSGNFVTGYTDGYVQKVYDSINRSTPGLVGQNMAAAIPLVSTNSQTAAHTDAKANVRNLATMNTDNAAYRVAIRSALLDSLANAAVSRATNILPVTPTPVPTLESATAQGVPAQPQTDTAAVQSAAVQATAAPAANVDPALVQPSAAQPSPLPNAAANTTTATTAASAPANAKANAAAPSSDDDIFVPQVRGPNDPPQAAAVASEAPVAPDTASTTSIATAATATDQTAVHQEGGDNAFVF